MKLVTYIYKSSKADKIDKIGIKADDDKHLYPIEQFGLYYNDMNELIEKITDNQLNSIKKIVENEMPVSIDLNEAELLAPIPYPKQDIICLGINYMDHAEESARFKKESFNGERPYAVYFSKRTNQALADGGIIPLAEISGSVDYETELAVIIRSDAKNIKPEDAYRYIFGYTILNDISARDIQTRHKQFYFGKSLDGFVPMGPHLVTVDEVGFPPELNLKTYVNGELRQSSNTKNLIFDISHIISELSAGMTLCAGTIISTGTPSGVGMGFNPPKFLKIGDEIKCCIEKIGTLTNYYGDIN